MVQRGQEECNVSCEWSKGWAHDELYDRLGTKEEEKDIYKMTKICEWKTRDLNQLKCIKDEANRLLVKDDEIKNRWREYFDGLFQAG
jgi:hypothetical protein